MLLTKNMTNLRNQEIDLGQPDDPVVVLVIMMTAVKTVTMKTVEQNHHARVELQMVFHMKNLQCYLAELIEWNIL